MRLGRKAQESEATELLNPKFYKWIKGADNEENIELLEIYMKVKGRCDLYQDIKKAPVWKIIKLKDLLSKEVYFNEVIEACHILTELSYKKIVSMRLHKIAQMYKFTIDGLSEIYELEKNLIRRIEAKDHKAGIDRLNKFSDLISLKTIADFYNEKIEQAENRSYQDCYVVWLMKKEQADIDHEYMKLSRS